MWVEEIRYVCPICPFCSWGQTQFLGDEELQDIYAANLIGPIRLTQGILSHMRARLQDILSAVGGIGALNGAVRAASFCASKAGLTIAMEALRGDVAHLGVKVCFHSAWPLSDRLLERWS